MRPKMTINVEDDWHKKIKVEAAMRGITISWLVKVAVDEWLERNPIQKEANQNGEKR